MTYSYYEIKELGAAAAHAACPVAQLALVVEIVWVGGGGGEGG